MKRKTAITALCLFLCLNSFSLEAGKPSRAELSKIEHTLKEYMDESGVTGMSVVLVKGGKTLYQKALGLKDIEEGTPLDINNFFRIASVSKSFTAASLLQLAEAGKLSLDDDINDYLDAPVRNPKFPDVPITIRMLLSHTSSLGGKGFEDYAPGKGYKYSNKGINIAGCVLEKISGERFDQYVFNHILKPMGLSEKNAGYNVDVLDLSNAASIYSFSKKTGKLKKFNAYKRTEDGEMAVGQGTYSLGKNAYSWSPAGGMKISAPDLAKWMMTLRDGGIAPNGHRILTEESVRTMITPVKKSYGLCLSNHTKIIPGKNLIGHTGSSGGLKSYMLFEKDSDWGIVIICSSCNLKKNGNGNLLIACQSANLLYNSFIGY